MIIVIFILITIEVGLLKCSYFDAFNVKKTLLIFFL